MTRKTLSTRHPVSPSPLEDTGPTNPSFPAITREQLHESTMEVDRLDTQDPTLEPRTETTRFNREEVERALSGQVGPFHMVVLQDTGLGGTVELGKAPLAIGRDPACGLVLHAKGVSRRHATVLSQDGRHLIQDEQSANGTFVNKKRVEVRPLEDGDLIYMGAATLKYLSQANPEFEYYRYLHQTSVRDPLTNAPNRRYLEDFLARELERSRRYGRPLSLLMVDVDHFKQINDTHGHRAGDFVLKELVAAVTARLRRSEFLSRYGGEEFALVAPETPMAGALKVAEKVRLTVDRHPFIWHGTQIHVTVSVGVAEFQDTMATADALVEASDACLYEAKRTGRNRVVHVVPRP